MSKEAAKKEYRKAQKQAEFDYDKAIYQPDNAYYVAMEQAQIDYDEAMRKEEVK